MLARTTAAQPMENSLRSGKYLADVAFCDDSPLFVEKHKNDTSKSSHRNEHWKLSACTSISA